MQAIGPGLQATGYIGSTADRLTACRLQAIGLQATGRTPWAIGHRLEATADRLTSSWLYAHGRQQATRYRLWAIGYNCAM